MTFILSVNGSPGKNGRHGRSAAFSGGGRNGRDGENATAPTVGTDAGEIDLTLVERDNVHGASAEISGTFRKPGLHTDNFERTYICATDDLFILSACGGSGGKGGIGGDGEDGSRGKHGQNATRYSAATNGGRGGDGGDAGAGTSGADGGNGGNITLRMLDTDAGLLMMFVQSWTPTVSYSLDVRGGSGGEAGRHGIPGRGGPGGFGGSGYSWTETTYDRNSDGELVARYTTHHKPGGYDGPSGSDGRRPTHLLYDGRPGTDGKFWFLIQDSITNKVTKYGEIFDIRLRYVVAHSVTGVFEPEAQIYIDTLTVNNISKMPTPRRDIRVNVNDNVWIVNKKEMDYTALPQLIAPKTSRECDCEQSLSFFLRKHTVDQPGPPLRATDLLRLTATMTGVGKIFPAFDMEGRVINIQYPIEFTHISHLNSMVVSQKTKVKWGVKNTSNVDFGALAPNERRIRVRLDKKAGEVSPSALRFGLKTGQQGIGTVPPVQTLEREYIFEIPLLRAGQTLQLEATLELSEAEIFEYAEFWLYLELGQIKAPSLPNVVHIQSFNVRVSTIYRGFPAGFYPDVLLVTNHKIARDEYVAWADLLKQQLGLRFFVWDISQMGHFGFTRPIPTLYSSEPTTLMKDLAGKTMIILDNEFEYGDYARTVTALTFAVKREWLQAVHENDNKPTNNDENLSESGAQIPDTSDNNEKPVTGSAKLIDEVIDVKIKAKIFRKMQTRMTGKATKAGNNLKKFRPHIQHLVIYKWHKAKKPLFNSKKNSDEKTGGCITVVPILTTTKQGYVSAAWKEGPTTFILTTPNLRGVIAGLGIDIHFRILERIFVTGPVSEDDKVDDVGLFLAGGFRVLDENEKKFAEFIKQQIVYDIAVELSTMCDGISANSSLGDEQILEMMENLRRLVWKTESLSESTATTTRDESLPTIPEESSTEFDQTHDDESNGYANGTVETPQIYSDLVNHNGPTTTALGDINEEEETVFYMFPVKQETPLGGWIMDVLAQLYAFIKCLRAGIQQSILPNRRTAKVQQQSMDLLHRIGDATIVDFADPRSSAALESSRQQQGIIMIANEESSAPPNISNDNQQDIEFVTDTSTPVQNQFNGLSIHSSSPMSIASGLSFASAMTSATRMSSSSFYSCGTAASRSRVPFKQLGPERQKTIKSFKRGAKLQLRKMIQNHYKQWKKDANYFLGGVFDPSKKALRRSAKKAVFGPFEVLVDNTLYGSKKSDGQQIGGMQNIIISGPEYLDLRALETRKMNDLEDMISNFFHFQSAMIEGLI
ncbi:3574_t:CDS:10 [Paraglomus occultum]|uniref:3574_t:CDS:1 n=1 Tax=Paraglomus occultum TaxID=144539 RepID=A0A9N9GDD3_9GLOM|nr:3574_t:CDS:10 [Paraglomus occultum]